MYEGFEKYFQSVILGASSKGHVRGFTDETGFRADRRVDLGWRAGLTSPGFTSGVLDGCYDGWVTQVDQAFADDDPEGTPAAFVDGSPVERDLLYDPEHSEPSSAAE